MNQDHPGPPADLTERLHAAGSGPDGLDAVLPLVYRELRRIAGREMRRERPDHTLDATALVHEAYLRLADQSGAWQDRGHFFGIAARVMRQVLVDHARRRSAAKRGAGVRPSTVEDAAGADLPLDEIVALDELLQRLEAVDPRLCRLVECRFFAGYTETETARLLGVTTRTVQRDWRKARAWLYAELYAGRGS